MKVPLKDSCMQLIETLHEGNMLSHPVIKRHVRYAMTTGDYRPLYLYTKLHPVILALAEGNIRRAAYQKLNSPYPYPDRDDASQYLSGPLKFGYVNPFDDQFGVDYDELSLPVIIPGRVGAGKSSLNKYLVLQLVRKPRDFNVIIPDLKGEYRALLTCCKHLRVLTQKYILINPLQVPGWMTPMDYIVFFSKLFTRENWLITTSESVLIKILTYIYKARGIFDGSQNWPTLKDLYYVISRRLESEKSFKFRDIYLWLLNRLDPYVLSQNFDCRFGIPHRIWRTENVVLEMDRGFADNMYSFIVSYLAGLRYTYNLTNRLVGSRLRTLLLCDEGRILFRTRDTAVFGESYITEIVTKCREFGVGYVVSSPETASFNQTLRAVTYTKICFPLTDGEDQKFIKQSFGLDDEQAEYLFRLPRFGQAIVRYGGYENPFVLAVPHLRLNRVVSDEQVQARMAGFYAELRAEMKLDKTPQPIRVMESVPAYAASLLYFLGKEPFVKIGGMKKAAGFKSPAEVGRALGWLEKNGFVQRESYRVSKRGRKAVFAVLTLKASEYLGLKPIAGKGRFEHKLYQHLIYGRLERDGFEPKIEGVVAGSQKAIDVLVRDEGFVAYEVTLHFENLGLNIAQDFAVGVCRVVVVTRDKLGMGRAIRMVERDSALDQYRGRIVFCDISDFFD
jgi:hypothetical protein